MIKILLVMFPFFDTNEKYETTPLTCFFNKKKENEYLEFVHLFACYKDYFSVYLYKLKDIIKFEAQS